MQLGHSEQIRREKELARPAALAALVSALAIPVGLVVSLATAGTVPMGNRPAFLRYVAENSESLILASVVRSVGFALMAFVAYYLYLATRYRRPGKPDLMRAVLIFGVAGPLLLAALNVAQLVYVVVEASGYAGLATQTIQGAKAILEGTTIQVLGTFNLAATLAFGFWLLMGSLYAMRVGLLTRTMGVIGIVLGAAFVLGASFTPIIMAFWLAALSALFFGFWPGGLPPAWESGTAQPWPSMKERAEQPSTARGAGEQDGL